MEFLVVGIENRTSKKGELYHLLHCSSEFIDPKYGVGSKTSVEFIPNNCYPTGLKVGDVIELIYGKGFDGKAYVTGARIVGDIPTIKK